MGTPPPAFDPPIIGRTAAMADVRSWVVKAAGAEATVLIRGESGTGKELVARNLHRLGRRPQGPFVAINCAALNPGILESELFGHHRGAFTGAVQPHAGLFEQANGGTLFLDEIGEIAPSVQAKLLRVLQEGEVRRMGSAGVRRVDVRVVAATNVDLDERIRSGGFRLDLFYRLAVLELRIPPLRERAADIPLLVTHFFQTRGRIAPELASDADSMLRRYPWPGNVRELHNELERIEALAPETRLLRTNTFSPRVRAGPAPEDLDLKALFEPPLPRAVGYLEENLLRRTLVETNWNKSACARQLGLSRQGLLKKMQRYGIRRHEDEPFNR